MNTLLKNKNILIMGVANKWSIAWGIAEECYKAGANLIFSYIGDRSLKSLKTLTKDMENVLFIECDVTTDINIENAFKTIAANVDTLHCVAHCIAHADTKDLKGEYVNTSRAGYALAQNISVYSLVAVSKYAKPLMTEGGSILTLTYYGGEKVIPNYNVMGVAKASLDASVKYLAADLGKYKIRVNAISAAPIRTLAAKGISHFNKMLNEFESKAPLRREINTTDVGRTAVYLCSELSSGVTGEIIHVDGGYNIIGI